MRSVTRVSQPWLDLFPHKMPDECRWKPSPQLFSRNLFMINPFPQHVLVVHMFSQEQTEQCLITRHKHLYHSILSQFTRADYFQLWKLKKKKNPFKADATMAAPHSRKEAITPSLQFSNRGHHFRQTFSKVSIFIQDMNFVTWFFSTHTYSMQLSSS